MAASRFDRDTALDPLDGDPLDGATPAGDGAGRPAPAPPGARRFEGRVDPGWWVVQGPNGGYLAAILLRGATLTLADPERPPLVLTTTFLEPPVEGPIEVTAWPERTGRSVATISVRARQGDRRVAMAVATFGRARASMEFCDLRMPEAPPPESCRPYDLPPGIPMRDRYDALRALGPAPFTGAPVAHLGGWIRTEDARPVDHLLVAAFADAWLPPVFARADAPGVAVPTVEMSVHFRAPLPPDLARPDDWCLVAFRSRVAAGGYVEEDGEV